jgi:drug/metabolite transporter (DMT)-like permease
MFGLVASFLFASSDTFMKVLGQELPLFQAMVLQAGFACLPLVALLTVPLRAREGRSVVVRNPGLIVTRTLLTGLGALVGLYSFSSMPLADFYAIIFFTPIFVAIASTLLLAERIRRDQVMAILLGFCAVLLIVQPSLNTLGAGHAAAFANVGAIGATILITSKIGRDETRFVMLATIPAGILLVASPGAALTWKAVSLSQLALAATAGFLMIGAQFATLEALKRAPASTVSPMQYSMLVWGLMYGMLIFGDSAKLYILLGAGLVAACNIYLLLYPTSRKTATPGPAESSFTRSFGQNP